MSFAEPYVVDKAHSVLQLEYGDSPFRGAYASFGDIQSFVSRGTPMIPMIAKAIEGMMSQIEMFNPGYEKLK